MVLLDIIKIEHFNFVDSEKIICKMAPARVRYN